MSVPSIPNLLSPRGSRGGNRGRGRGRGRGGRSGSRALSHDATIQGTDTDASVSRLSAVELGYLDDPFAKYVVQNVGPSTRRLPIINRGTYTRTTALDRLIYSFLSTSDGKKRQIISLGAGTDTRSFRLLSTPGISGLIYHEVDFPMISAKKLQTVQAVPALKTILTNPESSGSSWSSQGLPRDCQYWCHGLDLRSLVNGDTQSLKGVQTDVPTLLMSECCLCYLESADAEQVVKHFTDRIASLSIIIYEPIKPDDPFGRQMVSNLAARQIRMPTLEIYRDATQQHLRLEDAGFDVVKNLTIEDIWKSWVSAEEKKRVDDLEGLDEVEEWNLLAGHYIVIWGWRGKGFQGLESITA